MRPGSSRKTADILLLTLVCLAVWLLGGCENRTPGIVLGGGPSGGTFDNFATEYAKLLTQEMPGTRFTVRQTGGSVDNFNLIDQGRLDMALVNAEDVHLGQAERLAGSAEAGSGVTTLIRLYGTTAQLIVRHDSPYQSLHDLTRHRVAIGSNAGSAIAAERYFRSLGLWDAITPIYVSYTLGMKELEAGSVDAVWVLTGFPNEVIEKTNRRFPIRLLDLWEVTLGSKFFKEYPYYSYITIPAGTYSRQRDKVFTFQVQTLLVANRNLDEDFVYRALKVLFSQDGLARMRRNLPVARDLDVKKGLKSVRLPVHPGARTFLREAF